MYAWTECTRVPLVGESVWYTYLENISRIKSSEYIFNYFLIRSVSLAFFSLMYWNKSFSYVLTKWACANAFQNDTLDACEKENSVEIYFKKNVLNQNHINEIISHSLSYDPYNNKKQKKQDCLIWVDTGKLHTQLCFDGTFFNLSADMMNQSIIFSIFVWNSYHNELHFVHNLVSNMLMPLKMQFRKDVIAFKFRIYRRYKCTMNESRMCFLWRITNVFMVSYKIKWMKTQCIFHRYAFIILETLTLFPHKLENIWSIASVIIQLSTDLKIYEVKRKKHYFEFFLNYCNWCDFSC